MSMNRRTFLETCVAGTLLYSPANATSNLERLLTDMRSSKRTLPQPDNEQVFDHTMIELEPLSTPTRKSQTSRQINTPSVRRATSQAVPAGTRRLWLQNPRVNEVINIAYLQDGVYLPDAMREINWFMRDWRNNQVYVIEPDTIDVVAITCELLEMQQPAILISGYRSKATNDMLRRRSSGVAKHSLHLTGKAADIRFPGKSVSLAARAAESQTKGGVGKYSGSNFVHLDCGPIRSWGS